MSYEQAYRRPEDQVGNFWEIKQKDPDLAPIGGNSLESGLPECVLRPLKFRGRPRPPDKLDLETLREDLRDMDEHPTL